MDKRRKLRRSTRSSIKTPTKSTSTINQTIKTNYSLKWSHQSDRILTELGKLFWGAGDDEESTSDVTLFSSDGDCVPCHKIILMLGSPYFQKLFNQVSKIQRKDRDASIVVLGNITTVQLRHLVRFLYTGEVTVGSSQELEEFQRIAHQFGVNGLSSTTPSKNPPVKCKVIYKPPKPATKDPPPEVEQEEENGGDLGGNPPLDGGDLEESVIKSEPLDPVIVDDPGENFDDLEGPHGGIDDDATSNFSDTLHQDLSDHDSSDPEVSFTPKGQLKLTPKKKFPKKSGGGPTQLNWRTGKLTGWSRIAPLSESDLKRDWRKMNFIQGATSQTRIFYCPYGGKKCPSILKIKTLVDGTEIYFKNAYEHANHRGPDNSFGLSPEQKSLVIQCVQSGITQPNNILYKFEDSSLEKPQKLKLNNMLARLKKKEGFSKYWVKKDPKWPRRIRKKPEREGPPRKRGRPSKSGDEGGGPPPPKFTTYTIITPPENPPPPPPQVEPLRLAVSTEDSSGSSSPVPPPGGYPPNHFLGGFPFPPPPGGNYSFDNFR